MTSNPEASAPEKGGILSPTYLATTIGVFSLIAFNAFEAMAVTTVMPTIGRELDGLGLYALAFAAPLASGVVGTVAAGAWSDRRGPAGSLIASLVLFTIGVLAAGLAPTMEVFVAGRVVQGLGTGALTVSAPVPRPCTTRPATKTSIVGASPAARTPRVKRTSEATSEPAGPRRSHQAPAATVPTTPLASGAAKARA